MRTEGRLECPQELFAFSFEMQSVPLTSLEFTGKTDRLLSQEPQGLPVFAPSALGV